MAPNLRSVAALSHRLGRSVGSRQAARKYYSSSPLPAPFGAGFPFGYKVVAAVVGYGLASYSLSDIKEEQQKTLSEAKERLQQEEKLLERKEKEVSESV